MKNNPQNKFGEAGGLDLSANSLGTVGKLEGVGVDVNQTDLYEIKGESTESMSLDSIRGLTNRAEIVQRFNDVSNEVVAEAEDPFEQLMSETAEKLDKLGANEEERQMLKSISDLLKSDADTATTKFKDQVEGLVKESAKDDAGGAAETVDTTIHDRIDDLDTLASKPEASVEVREKPKTPAELFKDAETTRLAKNLQDMVENGKTDKKAEDAVIEAPAEVVPEAVSEVKSELKPESDEYKYSEEDWKVLESRDSTVEERVAIKMKMTNKYAEKAYPKDLEARKRFLEAREKSLTFKEETKGRISEYLNLPKILKSGQLESNEYKGKSGVIYSIYNEKDGPAKMELFLDKLSKSPELKEKLKKDLKNFKEIFNETLIDIELKNKSETDESGAESVETSIESDLEKDQYSELSESLMLDNRNRFRKMFDGPKNFFKKQWNRATNFARGIFSSLRGVKENIVDVKERTEPGTRIALLWNSFKIRTTERGVFMKGLDGLNAKKTELDRQVEILNTKFKTLEEKEKEYKSGKMGKPRQEVLMQYDMKKRGVAVERDRLNSKINLIINKISNKNDKIERYESSSEALVSSLSNRIELNVMPINKNLEESEKRFANLLKETSALESAIEKAKMEMKALEDHINSDPELKELHSDDLKHNYMIMKVANQKIEERNAEKNFVQKEINALKSRLKPWSDMLNEFKSSVSEEKKVKKINHDKKGVVRDSKKADNKKA